ncbi:MAG: SEC-C domain-containing protein [Deltaproteobacteria bacterium]|nr:SEC-C domain-containing protein [Deltaproteobacteria bacterium]
MADVKDEHKEQFLRRHRYLVRRGVEHAPAYPSGFLIFAAAAVDKALLEEIAGISVPREALDELAENTLQNRGAPPSECLDAEASQVIAANTGVPARRAQSKVGRNDPCPCGSGKKFKSCCIDKPTVAAVELEQRVDSRTPVEAFDEMRPVELAKVDLSLLSRRQVVATFRRSLCFSRWDLARKAVAELDRRDPADTDGWRDELIFEACERRQWDVVRAELSLLKARDHRNELLSALLDDQSRVLKSLDALAADRLKGSPVSSLDAAFTLLQTHPALGIWLATGSLDPDDFLHSDTLLTAVDEARRCLDLPPDETLRDRFERACDQRFDAKMSQARTATLEAREQAMGEKIERLRGEAQEARDKLAALERRERLARRAEIVAGEAQSTAPLRPLDKLERMKNVVAEGQAERARLRKDLSHALSEIDKLRTRAPSEAEAEETEGEESYEPVGRAPLRIPQWSERAGDSMRGLDAKVAHQALALAAELGAGAQAAWAQVKRLVKKRELLSARVDLSHRMLFNIGPATLEVRDVIHRRDLERWLKD